MKLSEAYEVTQILENALALRLGVVSGHYEDMWRVLRIERTQAYDVNTWSGVGEGWGLLLCNCETKKYARSSNVQDFNHWPLRLVVE